jgi:CheY-like chemotaxis protein
MNGIFGMVQLLRMTSVTEEQSEYLKSMELSANSLLSLINDILDLSKIESGKMSIYRSNFSPSRLVNEVLISQRSAIDSGIVDFKVQFSPELPELIYADNLRLKQILLNLVGNAVKFTEKGSITVSAAIMDIEGERFVSFSVADTGIGMSEKTIARLFNPFEQADSSTTRKYGGSGLGLSICKRLVELMNGRIWAESSLGEGSIFHLQIPCKPAVKSDLPIVESDVKESVLSAKPLSILVAEDNIVNMKFADAILKRMGHDVVCVDNGRNAVEACLKRDFDCILMDVQMPEMDGILAMKEIRTKRHLGLKQVPVIALTAHALSGDRENLIAQGFDGYLSKPLILDELVTELNRFCP